MLQGKEKESYKEKREKRGKSKGRRKERAKAGFITLIQVKRVEACVGVSHADILAP